jgi:hypothetical protein
VLSSSHHLMRVFGSSVHPQPLLMRASQSQTPERGGVGARGCTNGRCETLKLWPLRARSPEC